MAKFDVAFPILMSLEGWDKLTDNRNDPGGATKFGVSLRYMRSANMDLNNDGKVDAFDVRLVTLDIAKKIARDEFWDYDGIESQAIANRMLSFSYVAGNETANLKLQRVVSTKRPIIVDGKIGPKTILAINSLDPNDLFDAIGEEMQEHFWRCVIHSVDEMRDDWPDDVWQFASDVARARNISLVFEVKRRLMRYGIEKIGHFANIQGWMNRIERC